MKSFIIGLFQCGCLRSDDDLHQNSNLPTTDSVSTLLLSRNDNRSMTGLRSSSEEKPEPGRSLFHNSAAVQQPPSIAQLRSVSNNILGTLIWINNNENPEPIEIKKPERSIQFSLWSSPESTSQQTLVLSRSHSAPSLL